MTDLLHSQKVSSVINPPKRKRHRL